MKVFYIIIFYFFISVNTFAQIIPKEFRDTIPNGNDTFFQSTINLDSLLILSNIYAAKSDYEKAYERLLEYQTRREKENSQQNEQIKKVILFSLIPFVVAFIFIFFVFYRKRRENLFRQKEIEFNQQIADVQMRALRAQINPHFIFNCLNSIHSYILNEKSSEGAEYLLKFANLIRLILENSLYREIPLKDDIQALKLYIEMEQIRKSNGFDYKIEIDTTLNDENILVPPMIVQPFVENSIWHGLNNNKRRGQLSILISQKDGMLSYALEDNGEGNSRKEDLQPSVKKKSLGMSLTRERLEILNKQKGSHADFSINDVLDSTGKVVGKRVELLIPYEEAF